MTDTRKGVHYAWYPKTLTCGACMAPVEAPHIQPSECARHLSEMQRNRWISREQEAHISAACQQFAQQLGR